jgi:carboxylesterase
VAAWVEDGPNAAMGASLGSISEYVEHPPTARGASKPIADRNRNFIVNTPVTLPGATRVPFGVRVSMIHSRKRSLREQRMLGEGELEFFSPGRPPCVVAFHGFGGTASELRPVLDRVAQAGFAVDAALLPGHGRRVEDLQGTTFAMWVDAARERLRAAVAEHGRAVLLGFSMGALVALELASERRERPDELAGLVVLGNAVTLEPLTSGPLGVLDFLGVPLPDAYLLKPRPGDLADKSAMKTLLTYDRHPIRAAMEVYRAGPRVRALVGRVTCPTLIMHGRRDIVCSWRNATWLAGHLGTRDVSVRIFERSAHVIACDLEREDVAGETISFLRPIA